MCLFLFRSTKQRKTPQSAKEQAKLETDGAEQKKNVQQQLNTADGLGYPVTWLIKSTPPHAHFGAIIQPVVVRLPKICGF